MASFMRFLQGKGDNNSGTGAKTRQESGGPQPDFPIDMPAAVQAVSSALSGMAVQTSRGSSTSANGGSHSQHPMNVLPGSNGSTGGPPPRPSSESQTRGGYGGTRPSSWAASSVADSSAPSTLTSHPSTNSYRTTGSSGDNSMAGGLTRPASGPAGQPTSPGKNGGRAQQPFMNGGSAPYLGPHLGPQPGLHTSVGAHRLPPVARLHSDPVQGFSPYSRQGAGMGGHELPSQPQLDTTQLQALLMQCMGGAPTQPSAFPQQGSAMPAWAVQQAMVQRMQQEQALLQQQMIALATGMTPPGMHDLSGLGLNSGMRPARSVEMPSVLQPMQPMQQRGSLGNPLGAHMANPLSQMAQLAAGGSSNGAPAMAGMEDLQALMHLLQTSQPLDETPVVLPMGGAAMAGPSRLQNPAPTLPQDLPNTIRRPQSLESSLRGAAGHPGAAQPPQGMGGRPATRPNSGSVPGLMHMAQHAGQQLPPMAPAAMSGGAGSGYYLKSVFQAPGADEEEEEDEAGMAGLLPAGILGNLNSHRSEQVTRAHEQALAPRRSGPTAPPLPEGQGNSTLSDLVAVAAAAGASPHQLQRMLQSWGDDSGAGIRSNEAAAAAATSAATRGERPELTTPLPSVGGCGGKEGAVGGLPAAWAAARGSSTAGIATHRSQGGEGAPEMDKLVEDMVREVGAAAAAAAVAAAAVAPVAAKPLKEPKEPRDVAKAAASKNDKVPGSSNPLLLPATDGTAAASANVRPVYEDLIASFDQGSVALMLSESRISAGLKGVNQLLGEHLILLSLAGLLQNVAHGVTGPKEAVTELNFLLMSVRRHAAENPALTPPAVTGLQACGWALDSLCTPVPPELSDLWQACFRLLRVAATNCSDLNGYLTHLADLHARRAQPVSATKRSATRIPPRLTRQALSSLLARLCALAERNAALLRAQEQDMQGAQRAQHAQLGAPLGAAGALELMQAQMGAGPGGLVAPGGGSGPRGF